MTDEKHIRYLNLYKPNSLYWGLGIENETYLEFTNKKMVDNKFLLENHKRERYSLDYYLTYKPNIFKESMEKLIKEKLITQELPILMNAHSFEKTDIKNNSKMTYTKDPQLNPNFTGETLFELLKSKDNYFELEYGKKFIFDGDTIEFMTQNFYKSKINTVIKELITYKSEFIKKIKKIFKENNIFSEYGDINICKKNHGLCVFMTNLNGLGIFNNMTYHFNITLPTQLNEKCEIKDREKFIKEHSKAIKLLQYFEPLFIAKYGTPDFLSMIDDNFYKGSLRCGVSRYIGVGSYDTDQMITGKLLVNNKEEISYSKNENWWYNNEKANNYNKSNIIGYDFNFNKFKNHGIEFRIFDYFDENLLEEFLEFIIYLLNIIYEKDIESPCLNKTWNNLVLEIFKKGKDYYLDEDEKKLFENLLNINIYNNNVINFLDEIMLKIKAKYYNGFLNKYFI
jgi:hypothetical protein